VPHNWKAAARRFRHNCMVYKGMVENDFELVRMHWAKGEPFTAEVRSAPLTILAASCRNLLDIGKADNYVALTLDDDIGQIEVIVRRKHGKTPADLVGELKRENETLRKCLGLETKP
jgi:hypothetical protein